MASSYSLDSANATHGSYQGRHMTLSCSQTTNVAGNYSTISWTLTSTGGSSSYYTTGPTYVYINGTQVYYKAQTSYSTREFPAAKGSTSGSITVYHNNDGTKSITVSLETAIYYDGTGTTSGTWTLDTIPRGSVISTVPAFNVEDYISCTLTKYVSSYSDTLVLKYGSTTIKTITGYTSGATFTLTDAEILSAYKAMGTAVSGDFTFTVSTYSGSTQIGSSSSKTGTGTCAGTAYLNVSGTWRRALSYYNANGTWYKALAYRRDASAWRRGIK